MSYGLIFAGMLFLAIPSISIFDIMPDFIGYALLVAGISRIADLNGRLEDASSAFKKLFWVDLVKNALAILLVPLNDETTVMLVNFVYALVSVILLLGAFNAFAEGFVYLGMRSGSPQADKDPAGTKLIMQVFAIVRFVMCLIPDLTVLTNEEYSSEIDIIIGHTATLYNYRTLITAVTALFSLAVGVLFFVKVNAYVRGVCKSDGFANYVIKRYDTEVKENTSLLTRRALSGMYTLIFSGFIFFVTVKYRGIDILPDFFGLLLIGTGLAIGAKYVKGCKTAARIAFMTAAVAAATWGLNTYTALQHFHKTAVLTQNAVTWYTLSAVSDCVKYALICLLFAELAAVMKSTVDSHAVFSGTIGERNKKSILLNITLFSTVGIFVCIVGCVSGFLYMYNEALYLIGSFAFAALCIWARMVTGKIYDEAEKKYI